MNFDMEQIFALIFFAVIGFMLYRVIKHGGFKNAVFGGEILKTHGEVAGKNNGVNNVIKIHTIKTSDSSKVGIEIVSKTVGSWSMQPISLSKNEAKNLIQYLEQAII